MTKHSGVYLAQLHAWKGLLYGTVRYPMHGQDFTLLWRSVLPHSEAGVFQFLGPRGGCDGVVLCVLGERSSGLAFGRNHLTASGVPVVLAEGFAKFPFDTHACLVS